MTDGNLLEQCDDTINNYEEDIDHLYNVKPGNIYKLGNHRLMCGDSTIKEDIDKLMDGLEADMIVTDPPYNVNYKGKQRSKMTIDNDNLDSNQFVDFLTDSFNCMMNKLKQGGPFYVWYSTSQIKNFLAGSDNAKMTIRSHLIWVKSKFVLGRQDYKWQHEPCMYGWKDGAPHKWYGGFNKNTLLFFDKPNKNDLHPTAKPVQLFLQLILNSSKEEDVVLDPFLGGGTTIIACEKSNRRCYGMELSTHYCAVILNRWEVLTGKKAILLNEK